MRNGVVFVKLAVIRAAGESLSAYSLTPAGPIFVAVLHVCGVFVSELVCSANAELGVASRCRNIFRCSAYQSSNAF